MDFFEAYIETYKRMLENLHIEGLSESYIQSSTRLSWIFGIAIAVMILVAVFVSKKEYALGIITAIFQVLSAVGMQKGLHILLQTDLTHVEYITGSSQAEVDQLVSEYQRGALMNFMPVFLGMIAFFVAWVLLLVFIIKCMKYRPKVLGVFALLVHIIRFIAIGPFNTFAIAIGPLTEEMQKKQDLLFLGSTLLATLLIMIPCLVHGLSKKRTEAVAEPVVVAEPVAVTEPVVAAEPVAVEEPAPAAEPEAEA